VLIGAATRAFLLLREAKSARIPGFRGSIPGTFMIGICQGGSGDSPSAVVIVPSRQRGRRYLLNELCLSEAWPLLEGRLPQVLLQPFVISVGRSAVGRDQTSSDICPTRYVTPAPPAHRGGLLTPSSPFSLLPSPCRCTDGLANWDIHDVYLQRNSSNRRLGRRKAERRQPRKHRAKN